MSHCLDSLFEPRLADFQDAKAKRSLLVVLLVDLFWPRNVAQENFFFCFDSMTQRRAFLGYLYVLFWTLHVLWTSGVPMLAWCVVTCLRGSSRVVMELRRFLGFS